MNNPVMFMVCLHSWSMLITIIKVEAVYRNTLYGCKVQVT